ncbi:MAG TPA: DedA family protein [Opitutaceae bacterium]|nr:DedA family protein [Opitutaceae bacterium]HND60104.1 DedA family protein [Opitutaceae bacterium]
MHDLLKELSDWYLRSLETGGYPLIVLLMAIESSFLPLPSEVVIAPAAYLAHTKGHMSLTGIVLAGALGSWIGATIMYWGARWAGRPLVVRYGKYVFVPQAKLEQAERWAARFGSFGIFASRMLPVVRHLIGIPAGIVRMDYLKFSIYTFVGAGIWCAVLCWAGIEAGKNEALMRGEMKTITLWAVGAVAILGGIYYLFVHRYTRENSK